MTLTTELTNEGIKITDPAGKLVDVMKRRDGCWWVHDHELDGERDFVSVQAAEFFVYAQWLELRARS